MIFFRSPHIFNKRLKVNNNFRPSSDGFLSCDWGLLALFQNKFQINSGIYGRHHAHQAEFIAVGIFEELQLQLMRLSTLQGFDAADQLHTFRLQRG